MSLGGDAEAVACGGSEFHVEAWEGLPAGARRLEPRAAGLRAAGLRVGFRAPALQSLPVRWVQMTPRDRIGVGF